MYAVYASIVSPRSRFIPLKSMGEGRPEMGDFQILYTGDIQHGTNAEIQLEHIDLIFKLHELCTYLIYT